MQTRRDQLTNERVTYREVLGHRELRTMFLPGGLSVRATSSPVSPSRSSSGLPRADQPSQAEHAAERAPNS